MVNGKWVVFIIAIFFSLRIFSQTLIDNFESEEGWKIYKSDGVEAHMSITEGYKGKGIKFDYNFK